jgi:low affinity Fe/Cu permease
VINTGTTVVTFLMVFLIQRSQNKDSQAVHLKLNEIVAALVGASDRVIDSEDFSEEELRILHEHFQKLAALTRSEVSLTRSHSIEEAERRSRAKLRAAKRRLPEGGLSG